MDEAELGLASDCYGYGRWDASYWFIGPEQGQASWENNELAARFEAFRKLSKNGLSDCRRFHNEIHETRWHRDSPPAALQPTWKFLILLLKTFLDEPIDDESRRAYQRHLWGSSAGKTCVIELSGLPATSFKVVRERELFRQKRIEFIHDKMVKCRPEFVVIYGTSQRKHWEKFWKDSAVFASHSENVVKLAFTSIIFASQPTAFGQGNQYWIELGRRLRRESCHS